MKTAVAVVGGGITGAFTAYFLARGGVRPTIVDRALDAGVASRHNPGGLNPLHGPGIPGPLDDFAMASFRLHLQHHVAIRESSGIDFRFRRVQRLSVAMDGTDLGDRDEVIRRYAAADGFEARWLEPDALTALEPRLARDNQGGLLTTGNGRIDAAAYTQAVGAAAGRLGAIRMTAEVCGLVTRGSRVVAMETDAGPLACDAVVIATGAWSSTAAGWLGLRLPVQSVQGELLRMRLGGEALAFDVSWREVGAYDVGGGEMIVGGTESPAASVARPTAAGRASILERARRILPALDDRSVLAHDAGLRPATPDGLPIVGPAPGWDNVFLATGGGRKGMLLAAGMGVSVAALAGGALHGLPIDRFAAARFALR